jgi:RNA polymerase sigma factor (TIGR02999 family)
MATDATTITRLLSAWRDGDRSAIDRLLPHVYEQLRVIARRQAGGRKDRTLQTTALVHEAYLKLVKYPGLQIQDRHHFFAVAAKAMRQLTVDYARRWTTNKRGRRAPVIAIDDIDVPAAARASEIVALDEALERLAQVDGSLSKIVELRFFGGLSVEETADVLGCSPSTVKRSWRKARAMLHADLTASSE